MEIKLRRGGALDAPKNFAVLNGASTSRKKIAVGDGALDVPKNAIQ